MIELLLPLGDLLPSLPDPDPVAPPGAEGFGTLIAWVKWICIGLAAVALLIGGGILAWAGLSGRDIGNALQKIAWPFGAVIVVGSGIGLISTVAGF